MELITARHQGMSALRIKIIKFQNRLTKVCVAIITLHSYNDVN
jgi:hypothetical protein